MLDAPHDPAIRPPARSGRRYLAALAVVLLCELCGPGPGTQAQARDATPATLGSVPLPARAAAVPGPVEYAPPVAPLHVVRGFSAPADPYGAGHRGVDLAGSTGIPVRAAAAGVVTFAGPVAGRGVVVVAHRDGVRTEYEPLRVLVRSGQQVATGQVLGALAAGHPGCAPSCLHWGARHGSIYLDPLTLLEPLGEVRLLPWTGPG